MVKNSKIQVVFQPLDHLEDVEQYLDGEGTLSTGTVLGENLEMVGEPTE